MEAAHQYELAQVKADLKSCQAKNREQLEVMNMGLRDSMHRIEQGVDVLIEQRDKLKAEIAALREDAERYRAIRNGLEVDPDNSRIVVSLIDDFGGETLRGDEADAAIDAARSKQ